MLKNTSIRIKIALSFITIALFSFVFVYSYIIFHQKQLDLSLYRGNLQETRTLVFKSLQLQNEFLFNESRTNEFHITGTSNSAIQFDENIKQLILLSNESQKNRLTHEFELEDDILHFHDLVILHQYQLVGLKNKILKKGFFNYGYEGELRLYIHQLEDDYTPLIPIESILQLRRNEKDYMLRHDLVYSQKHDSLVKTIRKDLSKHSSQNAMAILLLNNYGETFKNYVELDTLIGFDRNHGMRKTMDKTSKELLNQLSLIIDESNKMGAVYSQKLNTVFFIFGIVFVLFLGVLIYFTSRNLSSPILRLSKEINAFAANDYKTKRVIESTNRKDEIGDLIRNFNALQVEIADHFANFRLIADERQKKLEEQREKIKIQKFLVKESRNLLKEQNNYFSDSIQYAERIQKSILPKKRQLEEIFGDIGLIYSPKAIVSGDFYWAYENESYKFAAVVDCTGHGVPGAFMSILGISYLNYGIKDKGLDSTGEILNYLNTKVAEVLGQFGIYSEVKDGMDIALIRICKKTNELQFSGAQRELIIQRQKELIILKPDKFPIGWILPGAKKQFNTEKLILEDNDLIVMYTDGFVDQFGGFAHKKYTRKRLYEHLSVENDPQAMTLTEILEQELLSWKGNLDQTDDICMICIRHLKTSENAKKQQHEAQQSVMDHFN